MGQNTKKLKRKKQVKSKRAYAASKAAAGEISVKERKMGRMQLYLVGIISFVACFFIFYSLNR
jgi:hypothetical protein